jgi:hypothetical protein
LYLERRALRSSERSVTAHLAALSYPKRHGCFNFKSMKRNLS